MKEHLKYCLRNYFIIVTLINIAMFVLGKIFQPQRQFGYEIFLYPLLYGLLASIPNLILRERKEPTVRQFLIREAMGLALCIVILLTFMFAGNPVTKDLIIIASAVAASIVVIFVAVNVIIWVLDAKTAKDMTEDLMTFQAKVEGKG